LGRTLAGLARTGWPECWVIEDRDGQGAWRTWIDGLRELIAGNPACDAVLMVQDDARFCAGLRDYLERTLWPAREVALCSPYCPAPYQRAGAGWHEVRQGWYLVGAVCWAIHPQVARRIIEEMEGVTARQRIDAHVGQWAEKAGKSVWYHTPSLVQHVGLGNSALGDPSVDPMRAAADFIGEEAQP